MKVTVYQVTKASNQVRRSVECDSKKQAEGVIRSLKSQEIAPHLEHYRYDIERTK